MPYFFTITRRLQGNLRRFLANNDATFTVQTRSYARKFIFAQLNDALMVLAKQSSKNKDKIVFGAELSSDAQRLLRAADFITAPKPFELRDVESYDRALQFLAFLNVYSKNELTRDGKLPDKLPASQRKQFGGTRRKRRMSRKRHFML